MFTKVHFKVITTILLIFAVFAHDFGYTHPGGKDTKGGHYDRETGKYHPHRKPLTRINVNPRDHDGLSADEISRPPGLRLASWNIRKLSDNSRNDDELNKIVKILLDYHLIAVSELLDEKVLKRIQEKLSEVGSEYGYQISDPVGKAGSRYREHYAFLYYEASVCVVKPGEFYPDDADGTDNFVRDPYWATFRAGKFDFSVIAVHVSWGDRVAERRSEIMQLGEVYKHVQEANGTEDDVILVGDFNREPDDTTAYSNLMALPSMTRVFQLPHKSHIRDSSLYDNIFFQAQYVTEFLGIFGIDKFDETDFGNDDVAANLAVSDHRPVWAAFRIDGLAPTPQIIDGFAQQSAWDETPQEVTVYVTRTGKKYHRESCSSLRHSKISKSLTEAKKQYGACKRCRPPS